METTMTMEGDRGRLEIRGDVDEAGAELLKARLLEMHRLKPRAVEIDFRGVGYIGSSGIGKLLYFYKLLAGDGATLSVLHLQPEIFRLFKELRLDTIFSIADKE